MKLKFLRIFSFAMALNILFSGTGLAFYEHTCDVLQETTVNIGQDKDCCGEAFVVESDFQGPQLKQGECCHTDVQLKKLDAKAGFSLKNLELKKCDLKALTILPVFDTSLVLAELDTQLFLRPPPLTQRPLHILFDVFLI